MIRAAICVSRLQRSCALLALYPRPSAQAVMLAGLRPLKCWWCLGSLALVCAVIWIPAWFEGRRPGNITAQAVGLGTLGVIQEFEG